MCQVNCVLLQHPSFRMMVLSRLLTCVDFCSFIGITAQVNTLHLELLELFSDGHTSRYFCSLPLSNPVLFNLYVVLLPFLSPLFSAPFLFLFLSIQRLFFSLSPFFLFIVKQHHLFSIFLNLFAFVSSGRAANNLARKTSCFHSLTLTRLFLLDRVATGSCHPLCWHWRRQAHWMQESTLAWPRIHQWTPSVRLAPSASSCSLVRRDWTWTRPVVICADCV